ncbi:MAG TPA: molybdenum cofactor guanylyltransferase [Verrucomicrobia bacterium]|nr:MAG: hypothetical protein A2X46_08080 [Lentisphaerae bacterium GWF2_57_35]HBA84594.1 molybdenum cofactor guanylyltransferase [Verrucomicrobiota bacterium]
MTSTDESAPLYGLVLTGGKSSRMKTDKAALRYNGQAQSARAFELLAKVCAKVYLSNRADQSEAPGHASFPQIHDLFANFGPVGGILSALKTHPAHAWLVTACDLPFLDEATLLQLIRHRDPRRMATAFLSAHDGKPEPLCAIYEPHSMARLLDFTTRDVYCPRKMLMQSDAHLLPLENPQALDNVNFPEEYEQAQRRAESTTPSDGRNNEVRNG